MERFDPQIARRIFRFLDERVAKLDDPRSIGEALKGSELGDLWKYRVGDYRIIAEIEDKLLQFDPVCPNKRKRTGQFGRDRHEVVNGLAVSQLDYLPDGLVELADIPARRCLLHHRANRAQHGDGSVAVSHDPMHRESRALDVRRRRI